MKKITFLILFFTFSFYAFAGSKVILHPSYEIKNTGLLNVSKIVLTDTTTRMDINITFLPNWWVNFNKNELFIQDSETKKSFPILDIEGAEFGEKIWMPKSGDSTIVLIFPKIDKPIKKIDLIEKTEESNFSGIWGLSLKKNKKNIRKQDNSIPKNVTKWIEEELAQNKTLPLENYHTSQFFNTESAHIIGYIKGYDIRLGFTTGIIYTSNDITHEDYPTTIQIYPDGRFEAKVPLLYPIHSNLNINNNWLPFYIEPGQTLSIIYDWNDFLIADRRRDIDYNFKKTIFQGPLAKINQELNNYTCESFNYNRFQKEITTLAPDDFKKKQMQRVELQRQKLENYIRENAISEKASTILRNELKVENATRMFDFVDHRNYKKREKPNNNILKTPVNISFYDFLKKIPMNDNSILISNNFSSFINRFEFCQPLSKRIISITTSYECLDPDKTPIDYIIEEKIKISDQDLTNLKMFYKKNKTKEDITKLKKADKQIKSYLSNHQDIINGFYSKYYKKKVSSALNTYKKSWESKDSVFKYNLQLQPNLVYEIVKIRSLNYQFKLLSQNEASKLWTYLKQKISTPFLLKTGDQIFKDTFLDLKAKTYVLPEGKATEIFKKIIDPFKGKILFIDFWATTCGPCVAGIKNMKQTREQYKGDKDIDFIFITSDYASPLESYNKFIKEQELKNTFRLSKDEYNYLRELFKFNGIPHYVVINKEGHVLNDDFNMYNFRSELKKILNKE